MKNQGLQVTLHVFFWCLFLLLPVIFAPGVPDSLDDVFNPNAVRDYMVIFFMMVFFYTNYFVLMPVVYLRKKYFLYGLLILVAFFFTTVLPAILFPVEDRRLPFLFETAHNIFVFTAVAFISIALKLYEQWKYTEKEKLATELAYLKSQINPHFLFNTLNSIYSLSIEKSDATPSAIVMLSGMMRYVISDAAHDYVSLEKELNYISDYIELQKIRLGNTVKIDYRCAGITDEKKIAPLILIPLIENAFKHGVNPEEDSHIRINILNKDEELHVDIFNNKVSVINGEETRISLGIENTRKRLEILYPGKHNLIIFDEANSFSVELTINLQ
jgi:hypothetical protein